MYPSAFRNSLGLRPRELLQAYISPLVLYGYGYILILIILIIPIDWLALLLILPSSSSRDVVNRQDNFLSYCSRHRRPQDQVSHSYTPYLS